MRKYIKVKIKKNKQVVLFLRNQRLRKCMLKVKINLCNQTYQSIQFPESSQHFMVKIKK